MSSSSSKGKKRIKLSFQEEEEDEDDGGEEETKRRRRIIIRDPRANTEFLNTSNDKVEEILREKLKKEYLLKQQEIKEKEIKIKYIHFDATRKVRNVYVKIGDSIKTLLENVAKSEREILQQHLSSDDFMFVKDNIIIPENYQIYYFYINNVQTRNGLLFDFSSSAAATTTTAKVVNKQWYNRNKHIYPASLWTEFDQNIDYTKIVYRDRNGFVLFNQK